MDGYTFEVWQDGGIVATATADDRMAALKEASHYAVIYAQDGPVTLYEVLRVMAPVWLGSTAESESALSAPGSTG